MAPFAKMENPGGLRMQEDDDFNFVHVELDCCGSFSKKATWQLQQHLAWSYLLPPATR